jgi:hypothetical protein
MAGATRAPAAAFRGDSAVLEIAEFLAAVG